MDLDHARYKKMLHEKLKKSMNRYIIQGELIGRDNGKTVKVPVKMIDIPRLRFKQPEEEIVYGDGEYEAGDQPSEDVIDVELNLEELARYLVEEFHLRNLRSKKMTDESEISEKYSSISSRGPESLRHGKRTLKKALRRQIVTGIYDAKDPVIVPVRDDYVYRSGKPTKKYSEQVVSFMIRDVSGSMGELEKELTRRISYPIDLNFNHWYKKTINEYIIHHMAAQVVDKDTFFKFSYGGGTMISTAYELCEEIIKKKYNDGEWSIFITQFSDGDNLTRDDDLKSCQVLDRILPAVNQFSFVQIPHKEGESENKSQFYHALETYFGPKKMLQEKIFVSKLTSKMQIPKVIKELFGEKSGKV